MTSSTRHLLVTGASGFLGSRIVHLALNAGWKVRAFVRNPNSVDERAEINVGDIRDSAALLKACQGVSAVIHAAGLAHVFGPLSRDYAAFKAANEIGTSRLVDAATKVGVAHIVLLSSVAVYGHHDEDPCDETTVCRPRGAYAVSKWRGELRASEHIAKCDGSLTILRMATIYGEGDRGNIAKLISALDRGRFIWPGSGRNHKSLIYKDDAARACLSALEAAIRGINTFNVSAPAVTMREIVTTICQELGRPVPRAYIPQPFIGMASAIMERIGINIQLLHQVQKFIHDDVYSCAKFENTFHFRPSVSLAEGILREVIYLRANRVNNSIIGISAY